MDTLSLYAIRPFGNLYGFHPFNPQFLEEVVSGITPDALMGTVEYLDISATSVGKLMVVEEEKLVKS